MNRFFLELGIGLKKSVEEISSNFNRDFEKVKRSLCLPMNEPETVTYLRGFFTQYGINIQNRMYYVWTDAQTIGFCDLAQRKYDFECQRNNILYGHLNNTSKKSQLELLSSYSLETEKIVIDLNDINFFSRVGDFYTKSNISGGGGGGSSITGAIVGGVIAGGAGAIIGSRKKIDSIRSSTSEVDNRETVIEINENNKLKYLYFHSRDYKKFLSLIPSKEISFINKREKHTYADDDIYIQIEKLSSLRNKGIISESEFEEKKKILLDKIK